MSKQTRAEATNGLFTSRPDMGDRVTTTPPQAAMTSLMTSLKRMTLPPAISLSILCLVFSMTGPTTWASGINRIEEYCENEFFSATCDDESAIIVTHALYGRMNKGKCILEYDTGCSKDVRPYLERVCAGRSSCKVAVSGLIKDEIMPCPIDLRSYLEAAFVCTKVVPEHDDNCNVDLSTSEQKFGFFSNHVIPRSGCGSVKKPWILRNRSGQKINITLIDFLIETSRINNDQSFIAPNPQCNVYVIFKELGDGGQFRTICNSTHKETNAILSSAQLLEIRLIRNVGDGQSSQAYSFMVKYEVLGCEDPDIPEGGWLKRDDFQAILGCHGYPHERMKITCNGTTWSSNPTDFCNPGRSFIADVFSQSSTEIFKGLSIIIITIVAAGVGLCILLAGLTYLKKRRNMTRQQQIQQQPQFYDKTSRFVQYGAYKETPHAPPPHYLLTYDTPQAQTVSMSTSINPVPQSSMVNQVAHVIPTTPPNFSENLYESPKFDRKFSDEVLTNGGGGSGGGMVRFVGNPGNISKTKSQENILFG